MVAQQVSSLSLSLCLFLGQLDPASVGTAASKPLVLVLLSRVPVLIDGGEKKRTSEHLRMVAQPHLAKFAL